MSESEKGEKGVGMMSKNPARKRRSDDVEEPESRATPRRRCDPDDVDELLLVVKKGPRMWYMVWGEKGVVGG